MSDYWGGGLRLCFLCVSFHCSLKIVLCNKSLVRFILAMCMSDGDEGRTERGEEKRGKNCLILRSVISCLSREGCWNDHQEAEGPALTCTEVAGWDCLQVAIGNRYERPFWDLGWRLPWP